MLSTAAAMPSAAAAVAGTGCGAEWYHSLQWVRCAVTNMNTLPLTVLGSITSGRQQTQHQDHPCNESPIAGKIQARFDQSLASMLVICVIVA